MISIVTRVQSIVTPHVGAYHEPVLSKFILQILILATCSAVTLLIPIISQVAWADSNGWNKILDKPYLSSFETTPQGIIVGEYDSRLFLNPYNGLYFSRDFGDTWEELGLAKKGITDIKHLADKLYAATFYLDRGKIGLYSSQDQGKTWVHKGPDVSTSQVEADNNTLYIGTFSHGLWISQDDGDTWTQKIGSGWTGPEITEIKSTGEVTIAATTNSVYISEDYGSSWELVPELEGKSIRYAGFVGNTVWLGSASSEGLYRSFDKGAGWEKVVTFGDNISGPIIFINQLVYSTSIYIGRRNADGTTYTVIKSSDNGESWEDVGPEIISSYTKAVDAGWVFSKPSYIFYIIPSYGLYRYEIPLDNPDSENLFLIPWTTENSSDLLDNLSAFFDHEYPLLGYGDFNEAEENKNTTVNFFGTEESQPLLYYSSHSGSDFVLPFDTPVLAAAAGQARYYYCTGCGHTIKITHPEGYQTIYMHLQDENLITKDKETGVWVETGTQLGHVGMTGNTTGPHLHFEVIKDTNLNGDYTEEYPNGRVDPFGWIPRNVVDPWAIFSWTDKWGTHKGAKSLYMWTNPYPVSFAYTNGGPLEASLSNKKLEIMSNSILGGYTAFIYEHFRPQAASYYNSLKYIPHTSVLINLIDHFGNELDTLTNPAALIIQLNDSDIAGVINETLKIYYYNSPDRVWVPLESTFDLINKTVTAYPTHFSQFAVFGEKGDFNHPITDLTLEGTFSNGWYVTYPTLKLTADDRTGSGVSKTFYSINDTDTMQAYTSPISLEKDGIFTILYRSQDNDGNLEPVREHLVKVDTKGLWKDHLQINNSTFTVKTGS